MKPIHTIYALAFAVIILFSGCTKSTAPTLLSNALNMGGLRTYSGAETQSYLSYTTDSVRSVDTSYAVSLQIRIVVINDSTIIQYEKYGKGGIDSDAEKMHYAYNTPIANTITFIYGFYGIDGYSADTLVYNYITDLITKRQGSAGNGNAQYLKMQSL